MIPSTTLGLVVAIAALGPGYLFLRVAERRSARPDRSGLIEAVELAAIGAFASTVALLAVMTLADSCHVISIHTLGQDPTNYLKNHPLRLLWLIAVVLVTAYVIAFIAAHVVYFRQSASIIPAGTAWGVAFRRARLGGPDLIRATIELRDGRKVEGTLSGATSGAEENRELLLDGPIRVVAGPKSETRILDEEFMVLREIDVLAITGRYLPARGPWRKKRWWHFLIRESSQS